MQVLLISTYELGHQPFGLAHAATVLRNGGFDVRILDLSVQQPKEARFQDCDLIAFYVPMHTATRLAAQIIPRTRKMNPTAHLAAFGLYAPMNERYLRTLGIQTVLGGEFEPGLLGLARRQKMGIPTGSNDQIEARISVTRQQFLVPNRRAMPSLEKYAHLKLANGERRIAGYTETSRGCKHLCRHCPVVPVYQGRFRAIPRAVILADIANQIAEGARHITFGDPDFLNGPVHATRIVTELHERFPKISYDVTVKIEHLLNHPELLPLLKETNCLFVTTAVESVQDEVLEILAKGHTCADFREVVERFDRIELSLAPTFVPFTPWTTLESYIELLRMIAELGLVQAVVPVQLTIRLLIPPGSRLLELERVRRLTGSLDQAALVFPWSNPDPRVDELHIELSALVQHCGNQSNEAVFGMIWRLAHQRAGLKCPPPPNGKERPVQARISEPWYCCAEPTEKQMAFL